MINSDATSFTSDRVRDIYEVARLLNVRFNDFNHYNKSNPLDELVFILLSVKTSESSYSNTYSEFKKAFPKYIDVFRSSEEKVVAVIHKSGLSKQRAHALKLIFEIIYNRFGKLTLSPLKSMSDDEVEEFLTSLPRVGPKVARCVMMYSLGRKVFPVDTHIWRITRRLGWVRPTNKEGSCRKKDMDRLQQKIPPELRYSLHVNMVSLGRDICKSNKPLCDICPIQIYCKKIGVRGVRSIN